MLFGVSGSICEPSWVVLERFGFFFPGKFVRGGYRVRKVDRDVPESIYSSGLYSLPLLPGIYLTLQNVPGINICFTLHVSHQQSLIKRCNFMLFMVGWSTGRSSGERHFRTLQTVYLYRRARWQRHSQNFRGFKSALLFNAWPFQDRLWGELFETINLKKVPRVSWPKTSGCSKRAFYSTPNNFETTRRVSFSRSII